MPWLFLLVSLLGGWLTYNAYRPMFAPARRAAVSFFAGWLTSELAVHHIAWQALMTAVFIWVGAVHGWPGMLGLLVTLVSWIGLARVYWRAYGAEEIVEHALQTTLGAEYRDKILPDVSAQFAPSIDWRQIVLPFPIRHPEVERIRDITYARVRGLN